MQWAVSKDGTKIAYEKAGSGPSVILVNGALSARSSSAAVAEMLSSDFLVFSYDRRGRGDSGDTQPYAVDREVEDLESILEEAGGTVRLFGHSSGAVLALTAAERLAGIQRLALYEPPFVVSRNRPPLLPEYGARLRGLIEAGSRGEAVEHFMTLAVGMPKEAVAHIRESPAWENLEKIAHTLLYDQAIMEGMMTGEPLPDGKWNGIRVPTLVMTGGASPGWFAQGADNLCELLTHAERKILPEQDHGPRPEVLVPVLKEFFGSEG